MGKVTLKKGKNGPITAGHPWVFSGAIADHQDDGHDVVDVFGSDGTRLGTGLLSPASSIRVRMMSFDPPEGRLDREVLAEHLREVRERRRRYGLGSDATTVYRLHNSEGDGIGGLMVDVLGPELVTFQLTTKPLADRRLEVVAALADVFPEAAILEVPAPEHIARLEGFDPTDGWHGEARPDVVQVLESGIAFEIATDSVQKTGHYADMRPHRQWIESVSAGRRVFDGYCYTGAFGLYAARGGASEVVGVDSSRSAVACARRNAEVNGFDAVTFDVAKADDALRSAYDRGSRFGVVVLDPPKLAPSRKHTKKALKVYESLAVQAARVVEHDGILALGSCSEAIGIAELERTLSAVAVRTARSVRVVYSGTQGADHPYPAAMPEGRYLSFVAAEIGYLSEGGRG